MTTLLLLQGRVIDPANGIDRVGDVLVRNGVIAEVGGPFDTADHLIDCRQRIVCPGFIELHAGVRDPGFEEDETTATATAAAVAGGFTTIASLPDTQPVVDNRAAAEYVVLQAERAGSCRVLPLGAVTRNTAGQELADLGQLADCGAVAFTDAKKPIQSAEVLRRALEYAKMFDRPIFTHPQDVSLTTGGVMHEGFYSTLLGLRGIPAAAEDIMVSRDIALAELTSGRVHLMCLSTRNGVERVRQAKRAGLRVTADVAIAHLLLTDEFLKSYDSNYKIDPPLRSSEHVEQLLLGLKEGTIDAISSDHQPFAVEKKDREIDQVPFGIVGLETLLPLAVKALIDGGQMPWIDVIARLTSGPARILGRSDLGTLSIGARADITVLDPDATWTIDPQQFRSRGRNTPFAGWNVRGRVERVFIDGQPRFELPTV